MLTDYKFLLFGGKGGVGKTTCAAAAAICAAGKGKKTLILSTDPAHSLADSFGKSIGNRITGIRKNLDALEMDAAILLEEYRKKYGVLIKQIADEGTFFKQEEVQKFFDLSLPGIDELMALIKVADILEENDYDTLVLDTAPTGHTIRLLELPELMDSYVKVLAEMRQKHRVVVSAMIGRYIKDDADKFIDKMGVDLGRVKAALTDTGKTRFVPVMIPEAMSLYETGKLIDVLEAHHIPVGTILINMVAGKNCGFCESKRREQEKYIEEARKQFRYDVKEVPLFSGEIRGESLDVLSKILAGEKYRLPVPAGRTRFEFKYSRLKVKPGLKFLLFGGKGGVGKTSCAAATALHESRSKNVLIFSTDPAHSLSDSFGIKIGNSITRINENLDALEIDAFALLNELKLKYKKEIRGFFNSLLRSAPAATIDIPYDRKIMEDLFDLCPPGIDEIMALKTMMDLMQDEKYGLFILDTAPSGHTMRLLELPAIAEEWVSTLSGILRNYPFSFESANILAEMLETIKALRKILADPQKTEFIAVAIPEAMAVLETQDLLAGLKKLNVPGEYLIINKIIPASRCNFCSAKRAMQAGYIKKLQKSGLKTIGINLFEKEVKGQNLDELAGALFGE